jgi:hypothetical protein
MNKTAFKIITDRSKRTTKNDYNIIQLYIL